MSQVSDIKEFNNTPGAHHVLKDVYSFFDKNLLQSVAIYIGCADWKRDLQLLETYSMPTVVCDPYDEQPEWREALQTKGLKFMEWLSYLKESGCANHFVNPKWIKATTDYPSSFFGTRTVDNTTTPVVPWEHLVASAALMRNTATPHFAVCRIELYGDEINVVNSLLSSKYRPSLLYIRWSNSPDVSQEHCEAAGHVQTAGYRLFTTNSNGFFLYHYTGQDMYSCCSWIQPSMSHPFIDMMRTQVSEALDAATAAAAKPTG